MVVVVIHIIIYDRARRAQLLNFWTSTRVPVRRNIYFILVKPSSTRGCTCIAGRRPPHTKGDLSWKFQKVEKLMIFMI